MVLLINKPLLGMVFAEDPRLTWKRLEAATLAAAAEQCSALVVSAALNAVQSLVSHQQQIKQAAAKRAARKWQLRLRHERCGQPVMQALETKPTKRGGGGGTASKCSKCGQPKKGTHGVSRCPFVDA